jgi:hypothetical protein
MVENETEGEFLDVRVRLKGDMLKRFDRVKKKLGFEADAEVLRWLITQEYNKIEGS